MTLLCRPRGRGNWRLVPITCPADLFVYVGDLVYLGRTIVRVVAIDRS